MISSEPRSAVGVLGHEQGTRISSWQSFLDLNFGTFGAQTMAGSTWPAFGWQNNGGTARGAFGFRVPTSALGISSTPAGYTGSHTVHLRLNVHGNASANVALAPATCVHTGGAGNPGNCYLAQALNTAGTRQVAIKKVRAGAESALVTVAANVDPGDVLSLGYRWNSGASTAELVAMVNGTLVAAVVDAVLAFDLLGLSARPGLWGSSTPSLSGTVGHWSTQWWVSDLINSYSPPPHAFPGGTGNLRLELLTPQRFTDDPAPRLQFFAADEIAEATWSFRRNGGCHAATVKVRPQQWDNFAAPNYPNNLALERYLEEPSAADWTANKWLGGLVQIKCSYVPQNLAAVTIDDRLFTGRIGKVHVDRATRTITIEAEGLAACFDEVFVYFDFKTTLRDAFVSLVRDIVAKGPRSGFPLRASWVRYNAAKITGVGSVLDAAIDLSFRYESARSVLDRLLRLLPDGFVWGVDREGDFYLSYSQDNYESDMGLSGNALPIVTYHADRANEWSRDIDMADLRNQVTVIGGADPDQAAPSTGDVGKLAAQAVCPKSVALHGLRDDIIEEDQAKDLGLAAKLAQAACKRSCRPRVTAQLSVTDTIHGLSTFWSSLVSFAPAVAVVDRTLQQNIQETGLPRKSEYILRRWGDEPGKSVHEVGGTGYVELARGGLEEMDTGFLVHLSMRFTTAHPGAPSTWCFLFGRPSTTAARKGWGALYWNNLTGGLEWWYEDAGGTQRVFPTNITVNAAAPANQVVHFTITRVGNTWTAYNGTTQTATNAILPSPKVSTGAAWRWFTPHYVGVGRDEYWTGDMDEFWMFQTNVFAGPQGQNEGIGGQQTGGLPAFISRNNGRTLRPEDAIGQLVSCKFNRDLPFDLASKRHHAAWRVSGSDLVSGVGTLVDAAQTSGTLEAMRSAVTATDHASGHVVGKPKRWGGPLRLVVDTVEYSVRGAGRVRQDLTLGEVPISAMGTLARVQDEIRQQAELLRREPVAT